MISPNGFCQSEEEIKLYSEKKTKLHDEFYANGNIKLQYVMKDGKLNGFYRKYDENGKLEFKQYYIDDIFDGVDKKNYYYPLFRWEHLIVGRAKEIKLNAGEAVKIFEKDYELADKPQDGNRIGIVRTRIPVSNNKERRYPVTLTALSKKYIYLKEYKARRETNRPGRHYYDLIKSYKVRRNNKIDNLFNVFQTEEAMKTTHTGVEFGTPYGYRKERAGNRLRSVQQFLGEPDYSRPLPVGGWFDVYYEHENLRILGHSFAVYFMEEKRPDWIGLSKQER